MKKILDFEVLIKEKIDRIIESDKLFKLKKSVDAIGNSYFLIDKISVYDSHVCFKGRNVPNSYEYAEILFNKLETMVEVDKKFIKYLLKD